MKLSIDSGYTALAIIMALNSAIAAFYYLRVVVVSFLDSANSESAEFASALQVRKSVFGVVVVAICAFYVCLCALMAQNLLEFLQWCLTFYR